MLPILKIANIAMVHRCSIAKIDETNNISPFAMKKQNKNHYFTILKLLILQTKKFAHINFYK